VLESDQVSARGPGGSVALGPFGAASASASDLKAPRCERRDAGLEHRFIAIADESRQHARSINVRALPLPGVTVAVKHSTHARKSGFMLWQWLRDHHPTSMCARHDGKPGGATTRCYRRGASEFRVRRTRSGPERQC